MELEHSGSPLEVVHFDRSEYSAVPVLTDLFFAQIKEFGKEINGKSHSFNISVDPV